MRTTSPPARHGPVSSPASPSCSTSCRPSSRRRCAATTTGSTADRRTAARGERATVTFAHMPDQTRITFASGAYVLLAISPEELEQSMSAASPLVRVPEADGDYVYINPAHVVMARGFSADEEPLVG